MACKIHVPMRSDDWQNNETFRCLICLEKVGTHGGVASLACGHRGCVKCISQVQANSIIAVCPLCQTPIQKDFKHGTSQTLDGSLAFDWSNTPDFDDTSSELRPCDSQQSENSCMDSEQYFRPCAYDDFNTWTPGSHLQQSGNEAASLITRCPTVDGMSTTSNGKPALEAETLSGENQVTCSMTPPTDSDADCFDGGQNRDVLSMVMDETWMSVHAPSAPPLLGNGRDGSTELRSVLDAEPPEWVPDSARNSCTQCHAKFQPFTRGRHHCRFCGGIFCKSCSKGKCLMPLKFMQRDPQRVCDGCYESLEPVQGLLIQVNSNASQVAIHDVTDLTCMRGWLNNPIGLSMQDEIYKATNTVRNFCKVGTFKSEQKIPDAVLRGAKGLAILTVVKVGMIVTYKVGTGLLVARRNDGSWSAPAAIMSCGMGWGLQAGGELVDFIIVLRSIKAVKAFSSRVHVSVGAGMSASAGPLGRLAEADLRVGDKGATTCYTYSCSQGAFAGVSFEGNVVTSRIETNTRFYGDMYVTPDYILFGAIPYPKAAAPLYKALQDLFSTVEA